MTAASLPAGIPAKSDFSVAWGRNRNATKDRRPFLDDLEAKEARDLYANSLRERGCTVKTSSLRRQTREWWDWGIPCNITCTVYSVDILEGPKS